MPQTIWKGAISFGLVTIPVRLSSATEEKGIAFRQVHAEDGGRIRYKRVCEIDGQEVAYRDIAKGYELPDGDTVVLTDEDFAGLPLTTSREIDVLEFVPLDQIDSLYFSKAYYLSPDGVGLKPYVLLSRALEQSGKAALVKVALRSRETLATLRPKDGALVLQMMLWPDEVRDITAVAPTEDVDLRPQEIAMAESYIDTLSGDFDPSEYTDNYRAALEELIAAKTAGRAPAAPTTSKVDGGTVVDLMAALQASVEAARKARGQSGDAAPARQKAAGGTAKDRASAPDDDQADAPRRRRAAGRSSAEGGSSRSASSDGERSSAAPKRAAAKPSTRAAKADADEPATKPARTRARKTA